MTLSTRIAPHLPYLRRFSRVLTGSQASGDAYVAATLEALIADVSIFPQTSSDRIGLYRLFCNLYRTASVDVPQPAMEFAWEQRAGRNLSHIAPLPRQAFLLVAVEGFNDGEAAEILEVEPEELNRMLAAASTEISRQVATRLMIIEDEPLIAMDIEQMVESLGHEVAGIARTRDEALDLYRREKPRMVLADIQLADGSSGIDARHQVVQSRHGEGAHQPGAVLRGGVAGGRLTEAAFIHASWRRLFPHGRLSGSFVRAVSARTMNIIRFGNEEC